MRICDFIKTISKKAKIINDVEANYYEFKNFRTFQQSGYKVYYVFDEKFICIYDSICFIYEIRPFCRIEELENYLLTDGVKNFPSCNFSVKFLDKNNKQYIVKFYQVANLLKEISVMREVSILGLREFHNPYGYAKYVFNKNILKTTQHYLNGKSVDDFVFEVAKASNIKEEVN